MEKGTEDRKMVVVKGCQVKHKTSLAKVVVGEHSVLDRGKSCLGECFIRFEPDRGAKVNGLTTFVNNGPDGSSRSKGMKVSGRESLLKVDHGFNFIPME
ncbi:hypothetical protein Q3G72_003874 [Acer saccharum]|nr:hypothetical protein Q3G72_003874 [Acer saccharum]